MKDKVVSRFLKYIAMDTQSSPYTHTHPSNPAIRDFARMLKCELDEMGIHTDFDEEHAYLYGSIDANVEGLRQLPSSPTWIPRRKCRAGAKIPVVLSTRAAK